MPRFKETRVGLALCVLVPKVEILCEMARGLETQHLNSVSRVARLSLHPSTLPFPMFQSISQIYKVEMFQFNFKYF
jgi:hypothetical protein